VDVEGIIESVGYVGLFIIIFAETGLLIGFFLPGDTLLLAVGVLASQGKLELIPAIIVCCIAAILGDTAGYHIGKHLGRRLFNRPNSLIFNARHIERARKFYNRHGGKTIFIARYLAFIRTFAPTVAGAGEMPYRKFIFYNVAGGITWVVSLTLLGYFIGDVIPNIDLILFAAMGIILLFTPILAFWQARRRRTAAPEAAGQGPWYVEWIKSRLD
jgi:membrane-associated protein